MERDVSQSEKPDFSKALAVGRELDWKLADSRTVRDAYAEAETVSQPWLFNHVARSWLYGAKLTQRRGLAPDAELVAVSVLLHDLGLARGGAPDRRFEVLGADIGRAFALSHDMGERRAEAVWDSIALHRGLVKKCVNEIRRRPSRYPASPALRRRTRRPRRPPVGAPARPAVGSSAPRSAGSSRSRPSRSPPS